MIKSQISWIRYGILVFVFYNLLSCVGYFNKDDAKELVESFIAELKLQNHKEAIKIYPTFKKLDRYITISDYTITNVKEEEESGSFKVYVKAIASSKSKNLLFWVKNINNKIVIQASKGLTPFLYKGIFEFAKKTGCVNVDDVNDIQIQEKCIEAKKVFKFNHLVLRKHILENVKIINKASINSYSGLSGSVTIQNNSNYVIPYGSYKVSIDLLDNNDLIKTEQLDYLVKDINANSTVSQDIFAFGDKRMKSCIVNFRIINEAFIDDLLYRMDFKGSECGEFFEELKKRNISN